MNGATERRLAPLNVFQKTQRLWDTIHPYNAAQAMEWAGELSVADVGAAFGRAVDDLRLGAFVVRGRGYAIEPATVVPEVLEGKSFDGVLAREMNQFFVVPELPFRPFLVREAGRTIVGLVYQHWVADSVSIRLLMRQWLLRLTGRGGPAPVRLPSGGLLRHFGPAAAGWSATAQAATLLGFASRMKTVRRVPASEDFSVGVMARDGPDGLIEALKRRAKADGRTVGDVMLAAATEACVRHGPAEVSDRRPDACVGTIVDLRARGGRLPGNVFGLFLGFTMTPFRAGELADFDRLLARVARERRTGTARRSAEASQLNMAMGYLIARRSSRERLLTFYRKRFPLCGGLSSVNMTPGWGGENHPAPLAAYHRVSPTGPLLPVVLTPTTLGRTLRVCCTYRTGLMTAERAGMVVSSFLQRLQEYGSRAR